MPFSDLIPAGVAEEKMVKVLREKYDKDRRESLRGFGLAPVVAALMRSSSWR